MTTEQPQTFVIYLLCYPDLPLHERHYVGITTPPRLRARMLEHAHGYGARFTKLNHRKRLPFYLTRTWETADPGLEERMVRYEPKMALCHRCHGWQAIAYYPHAKNTPESELATDALEFYALPTGIAGGPQKRKKGSRRTELPSSRVPLDRS